MLDREKVIRDLEYLISFGGASQQSMVKQIATEALVLLKEQEKKRITVHKKHVITWGRNKDEFSMRKLYEAICETLLDEGELFIARTDDHEKVTFVFFVAEGR